MDEVQLSVIIRIRSPLLARKRTATGASTTYQRNIPFESWICRLTRLLKPDLQLFFLKSYFLSTFPHQLRYNIMASFRPMNSTTPLTRDLSIESFSTLSPSSSASDNCQWASNEATPTTSPPSSRGESPERKLDGVNRHTRSDTVTALPTAPPVKSICFVGAGFVGKKHDTTHKLLCANFQQADQQLL